MLLFMYKTASKRKLHLSWEEIDFMNLYLDVRLARITKKKLFFCRLLYSTTIFANVIDGLFSPLLWDLYLTIRNTLRWLLLWIEGNMSVCNTLCEIQYFSRYFIMQKDLYRTIYSTLKMCTHMIRMKLLLFLIICDLVSNN